jgi:hypothetical protein
MEIENLLRTLKLKKAKRKFLDESEPKGVLDGEFTIGSTSTGSRTKPKIAKKKSDVPVARTPCEYLFEDAKSILSADELYSFDVPKLDNTKDKIT